MKRCLAALVTVAAALALQTGATAGTITLVHVNDTHSHLDATGPKTADLEGTVGGLAKAATVIAAIRQQEPDMLLLHAGDAFHGDLFFNAFFGVPEFQLMRQLGFDAMAVGNHEFDLGPDVLAGALQAAFGDDTLPLLSANLDLSGYPALTTWIRPALLKEVGGVRVGIFGMTVPDDPMTMPAPVVILGQGDPEQLLGIAAQQATALRTAGAEVVICLSHLGIAYDQALASQVPGIDIIVGGHDHYAFEQPITVAGPTGAPTLILQAGRHYERVGKLRFTVANGTVHVVDYALLPVDASVPPAPEIAQVIDGLKQSIVGRYGDVYRTPLATAPRPITTTCDPRRPARDTGMGDLITDALRAATKTDIALTANGLISEGLSAGPVVGADLFRPVSYGYDVETGLGLKIATFDIAGAELVRGLEIGLAYLGINDDFFLQVSGMRFSYDSTRPPGERVLVGSVHVGGHRLEPTATYSVTVNEVVAGLLPLMGVQVTNLQLRSELEYHALRDYVVLKHVLHQQPEGRIRDVSEGAEDGDSKPRCDGKEWDPGCDSGPLSPPAPPPGSAAARR